MAEKKTYGFYSPTCDEQYGCSLYEHVNGNVIKVTHISRSETDHGTMWDDIECKGEIVRCVRSRRGGLSISYSSMFK
jgi:hypothetical protein